MLKIFTQMLGMMAQRQASRKAKKKIAALPPREVRAHKKRIRQIALATRTRNSMRRRGKHCK